MQTYSTALGFMLLCPQLHQSTLDTTSVNVIFPVSSLSYIYLQLCKLLFALIDVISLSTQNNTVSVSAAVSAKQYVAVASIGQVFLVVTELIYGTMHKLISVQLEAN